VEHNRHCGLVGGTDVLNHNMSKCNTQPPTLVCSFLQLILT